MMVGRRGGGEEGGGRGEKGEGRREKEERKELTQRCSEGERCCQPSQGRVQRRKCRSQPSTTNSRAPNHAPCCQATPTNCPAPQPSHEATLPHQQL